MPQSCYSIEKKSGVWWLKSPDGERMFYTSVQCCGPKNSSPRGGPVYDGIKACGGDLQKWIERTQSRLQGWGFRGLGAWNHPLWHWRALPFTECLNIWKGLGMKPIFDADWEEKAEALIKEQCQRLKRLPGLVGYFLDNEIPWRLELLYNYFEKPASNPNRLAVLAFLRKRHKSVARLNKAWGTKFSSFQDLARLKKLPVDKDRSREDCKAFLGIAAARFFKAASRLLRKHDSQHLNLGARHAGLPPIEVSRAQRGATDVYSVNLYLPEAELDEKRLWEHHQATGGQPFWITEFSFHAPFDNRSGNHNTIGFGAKVRRQSSRGKGYAKMVGQAASLPFFIGADWFQFPDEPTLGRGDGEDVNFGMVDLKDRPYAELVRDMSRTNRSIDARHAKSGSWKPRFKPLAPLPQMSLPQSGAELKGFKFRPSLDPMPAKPPVKASLSWSPKGLKAEVWVKDSVRTVDLVKIKRSIEWFWMTDAVELLIRPDGRLPAHLDLKSTKIWAVPDGLGKGRPFLGAWHKGKRLNGKAAGAKVKQLRHPGGYGLSFFVPASAIQSGPLKAGQKLRFNLLVEDCEKVMESFWSGHQGQLTTELPATWGTLLLAD